MRVSGKWTYLYRALDSKGNTIHFMLSPYRDRIAAKHFLQLALWRVGHRRPRVINVDGHPAYPSIIAELKQTGELTLPEGKTLKTLRKTGASRMFRFTIRDVLWLAERGISY